MIKAGRDRIILGDRANIVPWIIVLGGAASNKVGFRPSMIAKSRV